MVVTKRVPVESQVILENLNEETLRAFALLADDPVFKVLEDFCRRYIETKRNQILDLSTENERRFANEASLRKGQIMSLGVLIEVIRGSKTVLDKKGG